MIDLKHEIERELSRMNPPDLWDRIQAEALTHDVLGLAVAEHKRRTAPWLAIAAVVVVATLIAAAPTKDGDPVQTGPASEQPEPDPHLLPQLFEFAEAPASGGIGVPPGGGLTQPAGGGLGGSTMTLSVTEAGGEVTGEARITDFVDVPGNPPHTLTIEIECSETDATDVVLGGRVTTSSGGSPLVGEWIALLIRRGNSATVWWASDLASCSDLLDAVPYPRPDDRFVDVVKNIDE